MREGAFSVQEWLDSGSRSGLEDSVMATSSIFQRVDSARLRIGELARLTSLSPDTLRAYERRGLVRPSARTRGRYREYGVEAVAQVERVQNALALGFTLAELSEFQRLRASKKPPCRAVRAAAEGKLQRVESERDEKLAAGDPQTELALLDDLRAEPTVQNALVRSAFRARSSCR
jgi:MerR family transcriptional regulator, Zn(II)-responsive regulator of zntA